MVKKTNLIGLVILISGLFSADAFAETIVKDANGIEYLADQIIVKIKSTPAKGAEKAISQPRWLMNISEAGGSVQQLKAKWAVTKRIRNTL